MGRAERLGRDVAGVLLVTLLIPASIVAAAEVSVGAQRLYTEEELIRLIGLWETRDGTAGLLYSTHMAFFACGNPPVFLQVMHRHPEAFRDWIDDLPTTLGYEQAYVKIECLHSMVLRAMERVDPETEWEDEHSRLLEVLRSIEFPVQDEDC